VNLLRKHLDKHGFSDIEIRLLGGYKAEISDVKAPIVKASEKSSQKIYNQAPVKQLLSPGSGPMWSLSSFIGGVPVVCFGIGNPDARVHSPNESSVLLNYYEGMRYFGVFIDEFAKALAGGAK
jgi:acetylornithine deacetylase/succinyl-diaminopimelate desuccinylase-like protein